MTEDKGWSPPPPARHLGRWWRMRSTPRLRKMVSSGQYGPQTHLIIEELKRRETGGTS